LNGNKEPIPLIVNGVDVRTESRFEVISPATGKVVHTSSSSTDVHALAAVDAAAKAFPSWSNVSPSKRRDILLKAAQIFDTKRDELVRCTEEETAAEQHWVELNVALTKDSLIDCAGRLATLEGKVPTLNNPEFGAIVVKEPFGVVFAMAP
jgi:acyl-CoA reductase-like NAD-dependent aldehyde dehydrogenase